MWKLQVVNFCLVFMTCRPCWPQIIQHVIQSLMYSIWLSHRAATEWVMSNASKKLFIPELTNKLTVTKLHVIEKMLRFLCVDFQQVWFPWGRNSTGDRFLWGFPWKPKWEHKACVCVGVCTCVHVCAQRHLHVGVWEGSVAMCLNSIKYSNCIPTHTFLRPVIFDREHCKHTQVQ